MKKYILLVILFSLGLAACNAQPPQPEVDTAIQPTKAVLVEQPTVEVKIEPTQSTGQEAPASVTYKIIAGESQLQYEVGEVFLNQNNAFNIAVGITTAVNGEIVVDGSAPQNSKLGAFTADISQFKSDSSRRDNAIRERFLQSSRYPTVTFVVTSIDGLPENYQEGQEVSLQITGDLTIREVTRPTTFDAQVKLEGDVLSGSAITTILMSDYEFGPISIAGVLNTEDQAKITLKFVARP